MSDFGKTSSGSYLPASYHTGLKIDPSDTSNETILAEIRILSDNILQMNRLLADLASRNNKTVYKKNLRGNRVKHRRGNAARTS